METSNDRDEDNIYNVTFINVSHPGELRQRETQKTIRRRVMRDIGKARRKRSRPLMIDLALRPTGTSDEDVGSDTVDGSFHSGRVPTTDVGKSLQPYGHYAVEPDARARQLFNFMETGPVGNLYRPFGPVWFASAIADRCSYYLCLANGAMLYHRTVLTGGKGSLEYDAYEESADYFGRCTGLLARRLGSGAEDGVSEGVVGTVLGFLCHDAAVGKMDRWLIHIAGLRRIVQLRGGFSGLAWLTHMFAFWFELTGCAMLDTAPHFPIPPGLPQGSVSGCELSSVLPRLLSGLANSDCPHAGEACRALEQTALVADFLNKNGRGQQFWEDGSQATRVIGPAAHYALSIPRMASRGSGPALTAGEVVCEMVRLALLILIARTKRAFSLAAGETVPCQRKFEDMLPLVPQALGVCPELGLWCLVVVARSHDIGVPPSVVCAIQPAMARLSLSSVAEAVEVARSIIWVDRVMAIDAQSSIVDLDSGLPSVQTAACQEALRRYRLSLSRPT